MAELKRLIYEKVISIGVQKSELDVQKSDDEAENIRREGNSCLRANNLRKATELYTKSLCCARSDKLKGKALGNRSACFFRLSMFNRCLKDIELAQEHDYMTQTLRSRRLEALRRTQFCLTDSFRVESDNSLPDALICRYDSYFGRGLYAARDILKGETILVEDPFMFSKSTESSYEKCDFCWNSNGNLIPCPECADTAFCDSQCLEAAQWYHKHECGKNKLYRNTGAFFNVVIQNALRSVFYGVECFDSVGELWDFFSNIVLRGDTGAGGCCVMQINLSDPRAKYEFYLKLGVSKPMELDDSEHARYLEDMSYALHMNKQFARYSAEEQCQLQRMFLYNYHINIANSYTKAHMDDDTVIYLMTSLFNHDCFPNARSSLNGNRITITANRKIPKNDQIFVTYTDELERAPRRQFLREVYGFDCRCDYCVAERVSNIRYLQFLF